MSRRYKPGLPALYDYKRVNYSHVTSVPGMSPALTADPWSYIRTFLLKNHGKKGAGKKRSERALLYIKLAEDFFKAANIVDLPTKGTLFYYGMMNLVKCFLSSQGVDLEERAEHHGLSAAPPSEKQVRVLRTTNALSIFTKFVEMLGGKVAGEETIELKDIFKNIPEIHNIYVGIYPKEKPKFLPVQIDYKASDDKKYLFTELKYKKEYHRQYPCQKFHSNERKKYFVRLKSENCVGEIDSEWVVYRSIRRKKLISSGKNCNWPSLYKNVHKDYSKFNICSILTKQGYYYYCDLEPNSYHHLCHSYMSMFYIGTAARYKPLELETLLDGEMKPLITEAVALCPRQFLYQIAGLIVGRACVIPYASI